MSNDNDRNTSPQRAAANRRNSQKSTGPCTEEGKSRVAMNSFKHGFYAAPDSKTREEMLRLGEDPDLLARFERQLTEAWRPPDAMQAMMVADLARLYADKAALRNALRARRLEQMNSQAEREEPIDKIKLEDFGYRGVDPCPAAFAERQKLLNHLAERLENHQWSADDDLKKTVQLLYGKLPQEWGRALLNRFASLARLKPEVDKHPIESSIRDLGACIAQLKAQVLDEESEYREQQEQELADNEDSQCGPGTRGWGMVMKQEARLDRRIDSKVKLLLRLQHQRPTAPLAVPAEPDGPDGDYGPEAPSDPAGEQQEVGGRLHIAGRENPKEVDGRSNVAEEVGGRSNVVGGEKPTCHIRHTTAQAPPTTCCLRPTVFTQNQKTRNKAKRSFRIIKTLWNKAIAKGSGEWLVASGWRRKLGARS